MSRYIPEAVRRQVTKRSGNRCEYCRRPEADSFIKFQVDHIISLKHGGRNDIQNLALACPLCNNGKGTDLGTIIEDNGAIIRLFNPRTDNWFEHFDTTEGVIYPITDIGRATVKLLDLNHVNRILERLDLVSAGLFPG
jgi:hypothetical protein